MHACSVAFSTTHAIDWLVALDLAASELSCAACVRARAPPRAAAASHALARPPLPSHHQAALYTADVAAALCTGFIMRAWDGACVGASAGRRVGHACTPHPASPRPHAHTQKHPAPPRTQHPPP